MGKAKQYRAAVAAELDVSAALVVQEHDEHLQRVKFYIADDARFVVAIANQRDVLGVWFEPLHSIVHYGLQVVALVVFRSYIILASAWIASALHQAERVAVHDDLGVAAHGFVEVAF